MDNLPVGDIEAQAARAKKTTVKERYQGADEGKVEKEPAKNPRPDGKYYDSGSRNRG